VTVAHRRTRSDPTAKMSEWDAGVISFSDQRLGATRDLTARSSLSVARKEFRSFLRSFREGEFFVYR
jgi:hypothetical protein